MEKAAKGGVLRDVPRERLEKTSKNRFCETVNKGSLG